RTPRGRSPTGSFNGATLSRTWKPRRERTDRVEKWMLQWSHAHSNVETAFGDLWQELLHRLQWSHAQSNVETRQRRGVQQAADSRFNGATLIRTWKQPQAETSLSLPRSLQWSHAHSNVET